MGRRALHGVIRACATAKIFFARRSPQDDRDVVRSNAKAPGDRVQNDEFRTARRATDLKILN
jgi:hypothetical protein